MAYYVGEYYDFTNLNPDDFVSGLQGYVIVNNVGEPEDNEANVTTPFPIKATDSSANTDATTVLNDQPVMQSVSWGKVAPAFILCFAGIIGCMIAMAHLLRLKKSLTTTSHWFLFHAIASNCILSLSLLLFLAENVVRDNTSVTTNLCIARSAVLFMSFFSSTFFLIFTSIDRYLSNRQISATHIKRLQSKTFIYACSGLAWIISIVLSIPIAQDGVSGTWATMFLSYFSAIYFIGVVISCLFCGMALRESFKKDSQTTNSSELNTVSGEVQESNSIKWVEESKGSFNKRRLTFTSALMTAYFFVSWILLFSVYLKNSTVSREALFTNCKDINETPTIRFVGELLVYVNAVFNPYIYIANIMLGRPLVVSDSSA